MHIDVCTSKLFVQINGMDEWVCVYVYVNEKEDRHICVYEHTYALSLSPSRSQSIERILNAFSSLTANIKTDFYFNLYPFHSCISVFRNGRNDGLLYVLRFYVSMSH